MMLRNCFILTLSILISIGCKLPVNNVSNEVVDIIGKSYYYFEDGMKKVISFKDDNYGQVLLGGIGLMYFKYELNDNELTLYMGVSPNPSGIHVESSGFGLARRNNVKKIVNTYKVNEIDGNLIVSILGSEDKILWTKSGGVKEIISGHTILNIDVPIWHRKCNNFMNDRDALLFIGSPREFQSKFYPNSIYTADLNKILESDYNYSQEVALNLQSQLINISTDTVKVVLVADKYIKMQYILNLKNTIEVSLTPYRKPIIQLLAQNGDEEGCLIDLNNIEDLDSEMSLEDWLSTDYWT